jgi:predicted nucleic acid-binding protein
MTDRAFLDTNVLVYVFDGDAPAKQRRARELLLAAGRTGQYVVSTQILQEFYVAVTRKLARPLAPGDAAEAVRDLARLPVAPVDVSTVLGAVGRASGGGLSLWDALVVETAIEQGCALLLTEDLQHGQSFDGLRVENPFRA